MVAQVIAVPRLPRLLRGPLGSTRVDRDRAVEWTERISAVTHVMSSAEHLANRDERRTGGVND